jgi:two-component system sensor histidine kinase KdpD
MEQNDEALKPDPQALLDEIKKESGAKGRIKIFLGYAPGVGKTYSMLEQARALKARGIDVAVGVVETHKRSETEALLAGLEVIPLKEINYKGIILREFDLEGALRRRPKVIFIDELAHSNAAGSTHLKRFQDVDELSANGIDVYTTVNIQHFESVNDVVEGVTGVKVQETVPDSMLDEANEVEVVDIPIEELHLRLKEGKVYIPEQAKNAVDQFFKRSNLIALREITLRRVATKLDSELVNYMKAKAIVGPWPVTERLLVCIAPSPYAKQLIRKAYQLADEIKAEWYAVYVESIAQLQLDDVERGRLAETLEYAEELGAKVRTISGTDVAEEIVRFAEQEKVTRIMVGKPVRKTLADFFVPSPVNKLINSRKGDVYLIEPNIEAGDDDKNKKLKKSKKAVSNFKLMDYFYSLLLLLPVIILGFALKGIFNITNFSIIFIISVVSSAFLLGVWPSLFVSVLSVLSYDFFFVPPVYSFTIGKPEYAVELLIFFATSVAIGEIARLFRRQREALRIRLENIRMLEQMGRELLSVPTIEQVLDTSLESKNIEMVETIQLINVDILEQVSGIVSGYLTRVIKQPNMIIFRDRDGKIKVWARSAVDAALNQNDYAIANWVYEKGEPAGMGTRTLTSSEFVFVPMKTKNDTVGVIGIKSDYSLLLPQDKYFITAISDFAAIAAEKCARMMGKGGN